MKRLCTASIFVGILSALAWSVLYYVPETTWWGPTWTNTHKPVVFLLWLNSNVFMPLGIIFVIGIVLFGLWKFSEWCCSSLRGADKAQERGGKL